RPGRHAAARSRLRDAVHRLQHGGFGRRLRLRALSAPVPVHRAEGDSLRREGAGETVGGLRHTRVDAALAGALSHLRDASRGGLIGTSGNRTSVKPYVEHSAVTRDHKRSANLRTGLILASIALVFFGGIVAAQYTGGTTAGIAVLGFAIIGF